MVANWQKSHLICQGGITHVIYLQGGLEQELYLQDGGQLIHPKKGGWGSLSRASGAHSVHRFCLSGSQ